MTYHWSTLEDVWCVFQRANDLDDNNHEDR